MWEVANEPYGNLTWAAYPQKLGVSLDNGAVLWKQTWAGGGMGGTMPIAYRDTILVGAGNGLMAFRPRQRDGAWVTETLWQTNDVTLYLSNPVVVGDTLYGLSTRDRGQYFAVDAKTGKVLWLGPPRQATNTAVVTVKGCVVDANWASVAVNVSVVVTGLGAGVGSSLGASQAPHNGSSAIVSSARARGLTTRII